MLREQALRSVVLKAIADALYAEEKSDRAALQASLIELYEATGGKTLDVKLPDGPKVATVSLAISQPKPRVTDAAALEAWAADAHPEWFRVVPEHRELNEARMLEDLTFAGADALDDGEVVPGVVMDPGGVPQSFSVRFVPDGRLAIADAWSEGAFSRELPGIAPQLKGQS